jgi:hypothetical protein
MYYNPSNISSHEMFDTYKNQYNQLVEHINQINRDQREILSQMQLYNERLVNTYNCNSQNVNFLYQNLDSIRINMGYLHRPYEFNNPQTNNSTPPLQTDPQPTPLQPEPQPTTQPSPQPTLPQSTPTNNSSNERRSGSRYNIEFLYSYIPSQETTELVDVPIIPTEEQINKMSKYYYDNKTEILKHKKIKYKQSKKNKNKNHG